MKIKGDIDIDVANRDQLLELITHTHAAMRNVNPIRKHPSGIYATDIPYDPVNDMAAIDYSEAEERGYFKIDILNVHVYEQVKDEEHLVRLMQEPDWSMLNNRHIVEQLIHLNNSFNIMQRMPEPIDSIPRLAMFLAVIRPAKKHLQGLTWKEVSKTVWEKDHEGYSFKKAHAISYAQLVVVHMNILRGVE
jgi:hypothetical protein